MFRFSMSSTPENCESSFRRSALVSLEKPKIFNRSCNLLGKYLKENGSLRYLRFDTKCNGGYKVPSLLQSSDSSRTMDLFPLHPSFSIAAAQENHQNMSDFTMNKPLRTEPQMAQMTMIYSGKVFVFNDVPPRKAEEIISLAKKETSTQIYTSADQQTSPASRIAKPQTEKAASVAATNDDYNNNNSGYNKILPSFRNNFNQDGIAQTACELPIARRQSLLRFLEKRKERRIERSPYQISEDGPMAAASKLAEGKSWLGLAPQPM